MENKALTTEEARRARLTEIYDSLPWSNRTLLKRMPTYDFKLFNDIGGACDWRIEVDGDSIGVVVYAGGRKLCAHGLRNV